MRSAPGVFRYGRGEGGEAGYGRRRGCRGVSGGVSAASRAASRRCLGGVSRTHPYHGAVHERAGVGGVLRRLLVDARERARVVRPRDVIEAVAHGRLATRRGEREGEGELSTLRSHDVWSERTTHLCLDVSTAKTICLPGPRPVGTFGRCAMANGLSAARTASQPCMARAGGSCAGGGSDERGAKRRRSPLWDGPPDQPEISPGVVTVFNGGVREP